MSPATAGGNGPHVWRQGEGAFRHVRVRDVRQGTTSVRRRKKSAAVRSATFSCSLPKANFEVRSNRNDERDVDFTDRAQQRIGEIPP